MTRIAVALLLLGLSACQAAPPPPVRTRAAARPAPVVAPTTPVDGAWTFSVFADRCTARATHRDMSVILAAGPGERASLSVSAGNRIPAGATLRIAFRGDGGNWQLPARSDRRRLATAGWALDAAGQERIQDLLGGGTVTASGTGVGAPPLALPDAGVSGRDWFGCVSRLPG